MKFIRALYFAAALSATTSVTFAQMADSGYFLHTITQGQSLYSIASMYNISTSDIIRLNPGSEAKIRTGATLKIPQTITNNKQKFHTIQPGETLYKLTQIYGVSATKICEINPGLSPENFKIGQVIIIPSQTDSVENNPVSRSAVPTVSKSAIETEYQDMHKVERKETVYSISRSYGITEDELLRSNPELQSRDLKKGEFLFIPYPSSLTVKKADTPTDNELFDKSRKISKKISTINVAVLLPFMTSGGANDEQAKMVEYYEGFLMAVDSLKRHGVSFNINTYDTGNSTATIKAILAKAEMKNMNIIFGPAYADQVKIASDFAKENSIKLVVPFTSKGNEVYANPDIYQINTPQSYLYSEVYEHFTRKFPNSNVIFLDAEDGNTSKSEFVKGFKDELKDSGISYKELKGDAIVPETIKGMLMAGKDNIFVPISGGNVALIKILPQLVITTRENPDSSIKLFGYPEWQTYTHDHLASFYELDTYFYTSFYTNTLFPEAIKFASEYRKTYSKTLANTFPKYGMLGFDTGYFFLKGLSKYGNDFDENINKVNITPVQTGFKFERVNNWGGFINKKVFFVHFTKNYELIKMNFE